MNIINMICSVLVIRAVAEKKTQRNFEQAKGDWNSWGREMDDNFQQGIDEKPHLDSEP